MMTTHSKAIGWLIGVALSSSLMLAACGVARQPVVDSGDKPPNTGGTISGIVRASGSNAPLASRRVTATDVKTGATFEAVTASNGGYTMKVPVGGYRLDVELRAGESLVERPDELVINRSDLDAQRDFVIGSKPPQ
jgi:hypothetical protein